MLGHTCYCTSAPCMPASHLCPKGIPNHPPIFQTGMMVTLTMYFSLMRLTDDPIRSIRRPGVAINRSHPLRRSSACRGEDQWEGGGEQGRGPGGRGAGVRGVWCPCTDDGVLHQRNNSLPDPLQELYIPCPTPSHQPTKPSGLAFPSVKYQPVYLFTVTCAATCDTHNFQLRASDQL